MPMIRNLTELSVSTVNGLRQSFGAVMDAVDAITDSAATWTGVKTFASGIAFGAGATFDSDSAAATDAGAGVTINKMAGKVTSQSLNTAAGGAATITVANSQVAAADLVLVSQNGGTSSAGTPVVKAVPGAGSFVITIDNKHASAAFNGTFVLSFLVLKA